jgi:gamma-butyrobetaine dioxygenase
MIDRFTAKENTMSAAQPAPAPTFIEDWRSFPFTVALRRVALAADHLRVEWADGRISPCHFFWLRDSCPCSACVHSGTREQIFEVLDAPADLHVASAEVDANGQLRVQWSDAHVSVYSPGWLRAHVYDEASRLERQAAQHTRQLWHHDLQIATFDHAAVMRDDSVLLAWLYAARDQGLTRIVGMPDDEDAVSQVAQRISFLRETNFGVLWEVRTKVEEVNSNAYTALELPHHTDLPTREQQPGLQFLHCLTNDATGGDSTFVDGFAVARALREEVPEAFQLLSQYAVEFRNKASTSDYRALAPIIGLDARGQVSEVRVANWLRAPFDLPAELMSAYYDAYRQFSALTRDPRFIVRRRLDAGQMWCFDNRRTLHARQAFDASSGLRFLRGCYLDRDELLSRIRVLERTVSASPLARLAMV